jgi:hypothetical protein
MDGLMLSALLWAGVAAWCFVACVAVVFCTAARDGDRIAREALRARRQEAQAREDTRPYAVVISFPQGVTRRVTSAGRSLFPPPPAAGPRQLPTPEGERNGVLPIEA